MKVSLITYHDEDNYGAILQTYATYRAVESFGFEAEIINLHLPHNQGIISGLVFSLKRKRFNNFRNKYFKKITRLYTSIEELRENPPSSDCYLVGSDQTWNPLISKENAMAYFLDFGDDNIKRISYASSFGLNEWQESKYAPTESVKKALKRFQKLLVRENRALDICKETFGVDANQVVDPVLLFSNYEELTGPINEVVRNKMVLYKLIKKQDFYDKASLLAKALNFNQVSIGSVRRLKGVKSGYPESIENWIRQIATSELVFTDSFHGTVMSLLYHRLFVVYVGDIRRVSRIVSLLKQVDLEYRICSDEDSIEHIIEVAKTPINYQKVDKIIASLRMQSLNLFKKALEV